jgi:hypothetical protein
LNKKEIWAINYLKNKEFLQYVDMLDSDFVIAFVEQFNAKYDEMTLGAVKCKELSKLLSSMHKKGLLNRYAHGVKTGLSQDGKFPKWVYSYELL